MFVLFVLLRTIAPNSLIHSFFIPFHYIPFRSIVSFFHRTMQPAISSNPQIPIYIKNTFEATNPGTRIFTTSTTTTEPEQCVCAFSSIDNMALINVEGSGLIGVHGVAKRKSMLNNFVSCFVVASAVRAHTRTA